MKACAHLFNYHFKRNETIAIDPYFIVNDKFMRVHTFTKQAWKYQIICYKYTVKNKYVYIHVYMYIHTYTHTHSHTHTLIYVCIL